MQRGLVLHGDLGEAGDVHAVVGGGLPAFARAAAGGSGGCGDDGERGGLGLPRLAHAQQVAQGLVVDLQEAGL